MLLRMPPSSSPLYCQVAKLGREMRFWSTMHVDVVFHPDNAAAENLALPKSRRNCWFPLISSSCVNSFHAFWEFGGIDLKVVIYWWRGQQISPDLLKFPREPPALPNEFGCLDGDKVYSDVPLLCNYRTPSSNLNYLNPNLSVIQSSLL